MLAKFQTNVLEGICSMVLFCAFATTQAFCEETRVSRETWKRVENSAEILNKIQKALFSAKNNRDDAEGVLLLKKLEQEIGDDKHAYIICFEYAFGWCRLEKSDLSTPDKMELYRTCLAGIRKINAMDTSDYDLQIDDFKLAELAVMAVIQECLLVQRIPEEETAWRAKRKENMELLLERMNVAFGFLFPERLKELKNGEKTVDELIPTSRKIYQSRAEYHQMLKQAIMDYILCLYGNSSEEISELDELLKKSGIEKEFQKEVLQMVKTQKKYVPPKQQKE